MEIMENRMEIGSLGTPFGWFLASERCGKVWKWLQSGLRFRIYRLGSLEVRTIQAPEQSEELGVVFSSRAVTWDLAAKPTSLREDEKIVTYLTYLDYLTHLM